MKKIIYIYKKVINQLRGVLSTINFIVIMFFVILSFFLVFGISEQVSSYTKVFVTTGSDNIANGDSFGVPIRLKISKINIDASIKALGLTNDGAMDVTKGPYDVAWYNLGPRPGETGSAVIAGHYGIWKNGAISVFNKLNKLKKGDKLYISDDKGNIVSFVVHNSKMYDPKADASEVFVSDDGKSHLNLITCVLDKNTKKYSKRLVVFTDKI